MLKPFSYYNNVFVEITKSSHQHGGIGWGFGTCHWSPSANRAGHDRYSLMREPAPGDLVLHFYNHTWADGATESRLSGSSVVSSSYTETTSEPPMAGDWSGMGTYYRIALSNYNKFPNPLPLRLLTDEYKDAIRSDLVENRHRFYPFTKHADDIRTVQGIYLAQCTPLLYDIFLQALGIQDSISDTGIDIEASSVLPDPHSEYREAIRLKSERYFFSGNPQLSQDAKQHYGLDCSICGFNFEEFYGDLGKGYIEVHHINPLSERSEGEWTEDLVSTLEDVTVLCANCHRMLHRTRPAHTVNEIENAILGS